MNKYFTEKELNDFKKGSINYPMMIIEKEQNEVIEVSEVVALSGMADNNGIPSEISIQVHRKNKPTEHLRYKLVKS